MSENPPASEPSAQPPAAEPPVPAAPRAARASRAPLLAFIAIVLAAALAALFWFDVRERLSGDDVTALMNVCMADGSVRPVSPEIDLAIWKGALKPRDGVSLLD